MTLDFVDLTTTYGNFARGRGIRTHILVHCEAAMSARPTSSKLLRHSCLPLRNGCDLMLRPGPGKNGYKKDAKGRIKSRRGNATKEMPRVMLTNMIPTLNMSKILDQLSNWRDDIAWP